MGKKNGRGRDQQPCVARGRTANARTVGNVGHVQQDKGPDIEGLEGGDADRVASAVRVHGEGSPVVDGYDGDSRRVDVGHLVVQSLGLVEEAISSHEQRR